MNVTATSYQEHSKQTVWAPAKVELQLAMAALTYAEWKGVDPYKVCTVLNQVLLAGGASGRVKRPENQGYTVAELRAYLNGELDLPSHFTSHTPPSPAQKVVL